MTNVLDFNIGEMLNFGLKWKLGWFENPTLDSLKNLTLDRHWVLIWNENQVDIKTQQWIYINFHYWTDVEFLLEINVKTQRVDVKTQRLLNVKCQHWGDAVFWLETNTVVVKNVGFT